MPESRFPGVPRPDGAVVDLLERALANAKLGSVRTVLIVAVNPVHQVEYETAGDLSELRTNVLLSGLTRATHRLLNQP